MTSKKIVLVHVCQNLVLVGRGRMMQNLAKLQVGGAFLPIVAGITGATSTVTYLKSLGIQAAILGANLEGLEAVVSKGVPFAVVVHRSGEESEIWNYVVPKLQAEGARVILDANVFGYADRGAVARIVDMVICNSLHTLWRHWNALGRPDIQRYLDKHRVIYNPVLFNPTEHDISDARSKMRQKLGVPKDAIVFFDICRPAPEKLDWMIVDVLRALCRHRENVYFIARSYPEGIAKTLRQFMNGRFFNLPVTSDEREMLATIAAGDVMLHMSSMGESFGMAIAEAMRCGRPVIANATPSAKQNNAQVELISQGKNGFISTGPATTLSHCRMLVDDPELRATMGKNVRAAFNSGALCPESIGSEFDAELSTKFFGQPMIDRRQPSKLICADYLSNYHPETYREPLFVGGVSLYWRSKVSFNRLIWRFRRKYLG